MSPKILLSFISVGMFHDHYEAMPVSERRYLKKNPKALPTSIEGRRYRLEESGTAEYPGVELNLTISLLCQHL